MQLYHKLTKLKKIICYFKFFFILHANPGSPWVPYFFNSFCCKQKGMLGVGLGPLSEWA